MRWFWFSLGGKNQGCINVEADSVHAAVQKAKDLGIVPEYDHVESFGIDAPEIPIDVLVSPEEMSKLEYGSVKYKGKVYG